MPSDSPWAIDRGVWVVVCCLDVAHAHFQLLEFFLQVGMLLRHLLVLRLPFIASLLQCLHLAFVVACLDIGLSEPGMWLVRSILVDQGISLLIGLSQTLVRTFGLLL
jgi:hypothetical protein